MTSLRFFVNVDQFAQGQLVALEETEFHHARDVVRVRIGEQVALINGKGWLALSHVETLERHRCLLRVASVSHEERFTAKLWLGLSLTRPGHLDFAIEKGTEVGVDTFVLFPSDKSEKKPMSDSLVRRLTALTIAATKQSGRLFLPKIVTVHSLQEALLALPRPHLWADLHEQAVPLQQRLATLPPSEPLSLLIGPESGWSEEEKQLLSHASPPVLLHTNVLRAETAAVVGAYLASLYISC